MHENKNNDTSEGDAVVLVYGMFGFVSIRYIYSDLE